uniref:CUB domain-containing protein n=1 Tax=Clytia hemisphaerica TaxID=252671 RepID=A0A7M5WIB5_9CNID
MELGSLSVTDRCGICNGDGGTCTTDENIVNNTLANSRMIVNRNLMQRLVTLEDQKSGQFENVAKRLTQLRSLMTDVVTKKCDGDTNCMQRYGLSKKDRIETRPSEIYKWKMVTSGCSASCGTGVETLFPECRRVDDGTPVTNMLCEKNAEKPNKMTRSCTHASCPPRWTTSKWSSCSRTCGTGKKTRNVYCSLNINTEEFLLPSNQCKEHDKPLQLMSCNVQSCPARWTTTPFGECSSTCGIGHRRRDVTCRRVDNTDGFLKTLPESDCDRASKPLQQIVCNAHNPCPGYRKCGGIHNATSGTISSQNFPGNYTKNIECVHEIDTSHGKTIRLNFTSFNVASSRSEISNECQGDFLRIIDGKCSQQNHRPFTKLCGRQTPGYFDSTGNHVCIKFVSDDDAMTDKGFSLRYEILKKKEKKNELINPTTDICDKQNDVITAPLGIVTSPNYPSNYPANENCGIDFVSPTNESSGYMLKFDSLNIGTRSGIMDCHTDYLEVEYNDKKERICGKELVVPSIHIPASKFRLNFRSSPYPLKQKGFVLTFVTKKFAEENSLDKNSVMKIGNFTQTIQDWHGQLGNQTNQSNERESEKDDDFIQPASEVRKKSSIDHMNPRGKQAKERHLIKDEKKTKEHEQEIKREKIELLRVLVELAKVNPSKLKNALKRNRLIRQRGNKLTTAKRKLTKTKTNEDDKKSINSKKDIIAKISPSNKLNETSRNNLENKRDNIYTIIMDDLQKEIGKISSEGKKTNVKKSKIEAEPRDSIYEIVMDPGFDDDLSIAGVEQTAKKDRCPPKDLFTCRDVVKYAPCQSSEHCMGSSCCETQCQSMPRVCSAIYQGV